MPSALGVGAEGWNWKWQALFTLNWDLLTWTWFVQGSSVVSPIRLWSLGGLIWSRNNLSAHLEELLTLAQCRQVQTDLFSAGAISQQMSRCKGRDLWCQSHMRSNPSLITTIPVTLGKAFFFNLWFPYQYNNSNCPSRYNTDTLCGRHSICSNCSEVNSEVKISLKAETGASLIYLVSVVKI